MRTSLALAAASTLLLSVACDQNATTSGTAVATADDAGLKIGYVDTDSILSGYTYLKSQTDILSKREEEAGANLERRARRLEEQIGSFQRRAQGGNLTPKQIENEQAALGRSQQELQQEQQRLQYEFQGEAARLQSEIVTVLKREVDAIQSEQNFDYILSYGGTSGVLAVNKSYDLTGEVLQRMNANPQTDPVVGSAIDTTGN